MEIIPKAKSMVEAFVQLLVEKGFSSHEEIAESVNATAFRHGFFWPSCNVVPIVIFAPDSALSVRCQGMNPDLLIIIVC